VIITTGLVKPNWQSRVQTKISGT